MFAIDQSEGEAELCLKFVLPLPDKEVRDQAAWCFNELAGGSRNGPLHLLNSNVDWGQDILLLEKWANEHPEKPLDGVVHSLPVWLGVKELTTLPRTDVPWFSVGPVHSEGTEGPVPGRYAVSVGHIYETGSGYEYFRNMDPIAQVGHTIFIYELSLSDVNMMRRDANLLLLPSRSDAEGPEKGDL